VILDYFSEDFSEENEIHSNGLRSWWCFPYISMGGLIQKTLMKLRYKATLSILGAACLTSSAQAALYTYSLSGDDDLAIFTGNSTGSSLTEHANASGGWTVPISGSFNSNEDYFYITLHNYFSDGNIAGFINGVEVTSLTWERTGDVRAPLGYSAGATLSGNVAYTPPVASVQGVIGANPFSSLATNTTSLTGVSAPGATGSVNGPAAGQTYVYRTPTSALPVPEPSAAILGALAGMSCLLRRRRA